MGRDDGVSGSAAEARFSETEITAEQQAGFDGLLLGLAFAAGGYCLGLPVRQGIWHVLLSNRIDLTDSPDLTAGFAR